MPDAPRPNIIYFNPDQLRADMLGCNGAPLVRTPNFDRLAREGVRFEQCHVQHTVCTPSRCSFMTGWYPHVRGQPRYAANQRQLERRLLDWYIGTSDVTPSTRDPRGFPTPLPRDA